MKAGSSASHCSSISVMNIRSRERNQLFRLITASSASVHHCVINRCVYLLSKPSIDITSVRSDTCQFTLSYCREVWSSGENPDEILDDTTKPIRALLGFLEESSPAAKGLDCLFSFSCPWTFSSRRLILLWFLCTGVCFFFFFGCKAAGIKPAITWLLLHNGCSLSCLLGGGGRCSELQFTDLSLKYAVPDRK